MNNQIDLDKGITSMYGRLHRVIAEAKSALSRANNCERKGQKWMALSHGVGAVANEVRDIMPVREYWFAKFLEEGYTMEKRK